MKQRKLDLASREDVRDDDRYAIMFGMIARYLSKHMDLDCRALVLIAVRADGGVDVINGGRSIDYDFNGLLRDLVEGGTDLNRPGVGGIH